MKIKVDFHLHTCLSPCADDEQTPRSVVQLAKLLGFDAVAISDHNAVLNYPAAKAAGDEVGLTVIPAMELTTSEEIHVVCLFPDYDRALAFFDYVEEHKPKIANNARIFGKQLVMNENDEVIRELPNYLTVATEIGIYDVEALSKRFDFFAFPSHVEREGSGVIPILGCMPDDLPFRVIEVSQWAPKNYLSEQGIEGKYYVLHNSDAHSFDTFIEPQNEIEVSENTVAAILAFLRGV